MEDATNRAHSLSSAYNSWVEDFNRSFDNFLSNDLYSYSKKELNKWKLDFDKIIKNGVDFHYEFFKLLLENNLSKDNKETCNQYLLASQNNIQRCQTICIFSITFRLNELTSSAATKRDYGILIISFLISVISFIAGYKLDHNELAENQNAFTVNISKYENELKEINDTLKNNSSNTITIRDDIICKIDSQQLEIIRLNTSLNKECANFKMLNSTVEKLYEKINRQKKLLK